MFFFKFTLKKKIIISNDPIARMGEENILIMPWNYFLEKLWEGEII